MHLHRFRTQPDTDSQMRKTETETEHNQIQTRRGELLKQNTTRYRLTEENCRNRNRTQPGTDSQRTSCRNRNRTQPDTDSQRRTAERETEHNQIQTRRGEAAEIL